MKIFLICVAAAHLAYAGALAEESLPVQSVCVLNRGAVDNFVMARAEAVVTAVFFKAGVQIEWIPSGQCRNASANVLRIEMDSAAVSRFGPETMAYALPYCPKGTTIHVFYDRIIEDHRAFGAEVLGHVIAHEIGHILEGIARHSQDGLMKAHWDLKDYWSMKKMRIAFAAEDVELMHLHLEKSAAGSFSARSERE